MKTVISNITALRHALADPMKELMDASELYDWIRNSSIITGSPYAWRELAPEAKRIRSRLLDEYNHFFELVRSLLRGQPSQIIAKLEEGNEEILEIVGQESRTSYSTREEAFAAVDLLLGSMLEAVDALYDSSEGSCLLIPDTNALLYKPGMEQWRFPEIYAMTIVLVPTVLSELDGLKIQHRNPEIRERAESLIRRIGEYGRRGDLHHGVPLVKGLSSIRAVAPEPVVKHALPWLDSSVADDRILASCIEIMRVNPRSAVVLVTRDINLQNKARFARLGFEVPPEPSEGTAKSKSHKTA